MKGLKSRGQAAVEFLMTYGWAFIVMIGVIAAVVALDPIGMTTSSTTSSCSDADLLECSDERVQVLSNGDIGLTYTNRGAEQLSFQAFNITSINGLDVNSSSCSTPLYIPRGQTRTITCETSSEDTLVSGERVDVEYESRVYPSSLGDEYVDVINGNAQSNIQNAEETSLAGSPSTSEDYPSEPSNIQQVLGNMTGDGSSSNPYIITDSHELQAMQEDLSGYYVLGNNIEASGTQQWNGGNGFIPVGTSSQFTGSLDGQGYTIRGLYIDDASSQRIGLFSTINGATIQNIGLSNTIITGQKNVGSLVGVSDSSTVQDITVSGQVTSTGDNAGLLAGYSYNDINNVEADGAIQATNYAGGAIGVLQGAGVEDVTVSATVNGEQGIGGVIGFGFEVGNIKDVAFDGTVQSSTDWAGGITGVQKTGSIEDAQIDGTITSGGSAGGATSILYGGSGYLKDIVNNADITGQKAVGGITGQINTDILLRDSYNKGEIDGYDGVGGVTGFSEGGLVEKSYNTGSVTGNFVVGGVVGQSRNTGGIPLINNSYNVGSVTGGDETGGVAGWTDGIVENTYNLGSINGDKRVGGVIGDSEGTVETSYSTGEVSGSSNVGGAIGATEGSGTNTNVYWDTQASTQSSSDGGTGLTTNQMQGSNAETNMTGFDFTNTWITTSSYPELQ